MSRSESFSEYLNPTPAELDCLISTGWRFRDALDRYGALLAGRQAEAIRDELGRKLLIEPVATIAGVASIPDDNEPILIAGDPEVANWPDTLSLCSILVELRLVFHEIIGKLQPGIPNVTALSFRDLPSWIDCCR